MIRCIVPGESKRSLFLCRWNKRRSDANSSVKRLLLHWTSMQRLRPGTCLRRIWRIITQFKLEGKKNSQQCFMWSWQCLWFGHAIRALDWFKQEYSTCSTPLVIDSLLFSWFKCGLEMWSPVHFLVLDLVAVPPVQKRRLQLLQSPESPEEPEDARKPSGSEIMRTWLVLMVVLFIPHPMSHGMFNKLWS